MMNLPSLNQFPTIKFLHPTKVIDLAVLPDFLVLIDTLICTAVILSSADA
jgi:hypothetical protein